jgi:hypothetical protein
LDVFLTSDHNVVPLFGSISVSRVHPGGASSSPAAEFSLTGFGL